MDLAQTALEPGAELGREAEFCSSRPVFFPPLDGGSSEILLHVVSVVDLRSSFISFMYVLALLLNLMQIRMILVDFSAECLVGA